MLQDSRVCSTGGRHRESSAPLRPPGAAKTIANGCRLSSLLRARSGDIGTDRRPQVPRHSTQRDWNSAKASGIEIAGGAASPKASLGRPPGASVARDPRDPGGRGIDRIRKARRSGLLKKNHRGDRHARRRFRNEEVLQRRSVGAAPPLLRRRPFARSGGASIATPRRCWAKTRLATKRRL